MKSLRLLLLIVVTFTFAVISGCNHESPTDLTPYDQNDEVKWISRPYTDTNGVVTCYIYDLYKPSSWTGEVNNNLPWVQFTQGANNQYPNPKYLEYNESTGQNEFSNYYHTQIWCDYNTETIVFLRYGKDGTDKSKKAIIPITSKYAVEYNPTNAYDKITKKPQKEILLAFRCYQGVVTPIDLSVMKSLQSDIHTPPEIIINKQQDYWLDGTKWTEVVGIEKNNIVWEFPDGTLCYGWNIKNTISVYNDKINRIEGDLKITITDNLGKYIIITKKITAIRK